MNRLIDAIDLDIPIRNRTETRTRQQAQTPRNNARLVGDDVAKEITRQHDPVQRARILHHQHRRRVDELVAQRQGRKLVRHHSRHGLAPQPARRQHVGLVEAPDGQGRV